MATLRRRLGAVTETAQSGVEIGVLRGELVKEGSSWAALQLSLKTRPASLRDLLETAHVYELKGDQRMKAFDACADGYSVFSDARRRHKL